MYKKILVRAHNWIGDGVMATPTLSGLRRAFKDAEIVLLAKPAVAALLEAQPDIDRIIPYEKPGKDAGALGLWRLSQRLKKEKFDLAFLIQNALEAALIAFCAGIPERVGYAADGRSLLLTRSLKLKDAPLHCRERYRALLALVSAEAEGRGPYLHVTSAERAAARALLQVEGRSEGKPLVGLNPGAAYGSSKRWFPERFAAVADRLSVEYGSESLLFWGPGELDLAEAVQKAMQQPALVLKRKTTVREMMALIAQCDLFISNDSGPMHIASALGIPQVVVFGPTDPAAYYPDGLNDRMLHVPVDCYPCKHRTCPIDHRCMDRVSAEAVFETAAALLQTGKEKRGAVFLDRDGTINADEGYIDAIDRFHFFPGAAAAIAKLNRRGIPVMLVTNQSGIARGFFDEAFLDRLHRYLQGLLAREGAYLDGIYYCPHHPDFSACDCRKPARGMIDAAILDHGIDFSKSFVVGDKSLDIALAQDGAQGILVQTGEGGTSLRELETAGSLPAHVAKDLAGAVDWILDHYEGGQHGDQ